MSTTTSPQEQHEPRAPKHLAGNLWLLRYPLTVLGAEMGRNVTIIRLASGRLVIHSMAPFTAPDLDAIRALGTPGWLVEAMLLHDTYAKEGRAAFPGIPFLAPPGFEKAVHFPTEPLSPPPAEWAGELEVFPLEGLPFTREHAVLHLPSRTLIVADLVFNFREDERGWTRFFHRHVAGLKRYPAMSRPFRLTIRDRDAFRASTAKVMARDFSRIIVGHGEVIESNGKALLAQALADAGVA